MGPFVRNRLGRVNSVGAESKMANLERFFLPPYCVVMPMWDHRLRSKAEVDRYQCKDMTARTR